MHSYSLKGEYGRADIIANSDFSGDVKIHWWQPHPDRDPHTIHSAEIPGELFTQMIGLIIELRLGDIGEKLAQVILDDILDAD